MSMFKDWLAHMGWTAAKTQTVCGVSRTVTDRMSASEPTTVERLAFSALAAGLEPWSPANAHEAAALRPVVDAIRSAVNDREERSS